MGKYHRLYKRKGKYKFEIIRKHFLSVLLTRRWRHGELGAHARVRVHIELVCGLWARLSVDLKFAVFIIMARYMRPPNTSLFIRNISDDSRLVRMCTSYWAVCTLRERAHARVCVVKTSLTIINVSCGWIYIMIRHSSKVILLILYIKL